MQPMNWRPAAFYTQSNEALRCTLCPFRCALAEGELGRCRVRRRRGDLLETATFSTSVLHRHSIERKPLYHFRPGLQVLTLAAPGCTFTCSYCQNHRLSQYGRSAEASWSARPLEPAEIMAEAQNTGGIAFSYSEPTLAAELSLALAPLAQAAGLALIWKSNGFLTLEAVAALAPVLDAINIDIKAAREGAHRRLTGAPLGPILEALPAFVAAGVWVEISTPIIPGFNDDDDHLHALAERVAALDVPWHLLRFHPDYRMSGPPTPPETLARARDIGRQVGVKHVYVERALGPEGRQTCCGACGEVVIQRDIEALAYNALVEGRCPRCAAPVAGRWR